MLSSSVHVPSLYEHNKDDWFITLGWNMGIQSLRESQRYFRWTALPWMIKANDYTKDTEAISFNFSVMLHLGTL